MNPLKIKSDYRTAIKQVRLWLITERGHRCEECGKEDNVLEIHHRDGCGLNWKKSNLELICHQCHAIITNGNRCIEREKALFIASNQISIEPLDQEYIRQNYLESHPRARLA